MSRRGTHCVYCIRRHIPSRHKKTLPLRKSLTVNKDGINDASHPGMAYRVCYSSTLLHNGVTTRNSSIGKPGRYYSVSPQSSSYTYVRVLALPEPRAATACCVVLRSSAHARCRIFQRRPLFYAWCNRMPPWGAKHQADSSARAMRSPSAPRLSVREQTKKLTLVAQTNLISCILGQAQSIMLGRA